MFDVDGHWLPGFDPATGSLVLPLWLAGALAALFVALGMMAFNRRDAGGSVTPLLRYAAILLGLALVWTYFDQSASREQDTERRALAARADELTARAVTPGSALSCIDARAGDVVEAACEQAVFGSPEAVASAVAYAGARLALLADAGARSGRGSAEPALRGLRQSIEADRYGLMAHVLATRQGCTVEACDAFAWLGDTSHIRTNLKQRTFDMFVAQNATRWSDHAPGAMAAANGEPALAAISKGLGGEPKGTPVPTKYDFPSADSIPPVSIMNAEPAMPNPPSRSAASTNAAGASGATASAPLPTPRKPPQRHAAPKPSAAPGAPMALPSAVEPEPAAAQ